MMLCMSVTVLADDTSVTQSSTVQSGTTIAEYKQSSGFTVVIPAEITVDSGSAITVEAKTVYLNHGDYLHVKVSSSDWKLKLEGDNSTTLAYKLNDGNTDITSAKEVLLVESGTTSGKVSLSASLADDAEVKKSGTYKDTLTFTVTVDQTKN
jgi:hypothetical protein